ncbi:adenylate/guanylate cyclase domain-containing protein [Roseovarius sp. 2305UL8-3]|uniref:adenylate/guanylate cyclase domain-containing protein n=1 Tax=Roseovarius conchicola TaxID=3121636 RepID=UPI0035272C36
MSIDLTAIISTGIGALAGVVGTFVVDYKTKAGLKTEIAALKNDLGQKIQENKTLKTAAASANSGVTELIDAKKAAGEALKDLIDHSGWDRATLYLPTWDRYDNFLGLVVIATAPTDLSQDDFLGTVFSGQDSRAVKSYLSGQDNTSTQAVYSFDNLRPTETYAHPLRTSGIDGDGSFVGVLQLLNDQKKERPDGLEKAKQATRLFEEHLTEQAAMLKSVRSEDLKEIGIDVPVTSVRGTALIMDISNSSELFMNEAKSKVTRALMERIIKESVDLIVDGGGTFESFTGDGFLAAFPSTETSNSADSALRCAESVHEAFSKIVSHYAKDLDGLALELNIRFGMSTGILHPMVLSFGHLRSASILGRAPSLAKRICDAAPRDQYSVAVDLATLAELDDETQKRFMTQTGNQNDLRYYAILR